MKKTKYRMMITTYTFFSAVKIIRHACYEHEFMQYEY